MRPGTLTEEQAVAATLAHDARIQVALARVRVAEADANQARLLPNPVLGVDVRWPRGGGTNTVFEATISEDLLPVLEKPAQVKAADNRLRGAAADALGAVLDVMTEVRATFASACEIEVEVRSARARSEALAKVRSISEIKLREGEISKLDTATLDAQLQQASLDLADLRLRREELRLKLARLMGEPKSAADWKLEAAPEAVAGAGPEENWVAGGLAHRPELQSKVWELRALGQEVTLAALSPLQGLNAGAHVERDPQWRLGPTLAVPLPIFDWGQAAKEKAEAMRSVARHEFVELQREAIEEIRMAYKTLEESRASARDAREKLLPLQRTQVEQARLAYREGEADLVTTLLAENDYRLAEVRVAQLEDRAAQARLKLERAVGGAAFAGEIATTRSAGGER